MDYRDHFKTIDAALRYAYLMCSNTPINDKIIRLRAEEMEKLPYQTADMRGFFGNWVKYNATIPKLNDFYKYLKNNGRLEHSKKEFGCDICRNKSVGYVEVEDKRENLYLYPCVCNWTLFKKVFPGSESKIKTLNDFDTLLSKHSMSLTEYQKEC